MKIKLLVFCFAALFLSAVPARAGLWLEVDIEKTELTYTETNQHADIGLTTDSELLANLWDDASLEDSTEIYNRPGFGDGSFNTAMALDFMKIGSEWTATGSLDVTDTSLDSRILADFTSTEILMESVSGAYTITIKGTLGNNMAPILTGPDPWTFQGEFEPSILSAYGVDGVENQITIEDWSKWTDGRVVTMHYTVDVSTLDDFFAFDGTGFQGDIDITITPIPAAVVLGVIGLGVVGLKLRKYA